MLFGNPLLREVRTFYREEYLIGTFALDLIERRLGIAFPADEAASIALHIVNAGVQHPHARHHRYDKDHSGCP